MKHSLPARLLLPVFCISVLGFAGCTIVPGVGGKPSIVIASPPSGSTYNEGDTVAVQSTAIDAVAIARVELLVDGSSVRSDNPPSPQSSFTVIQTWKAVAGTHIISVRAFNTAGVPSDPAGVSITVSPAAGAPTPAPSATAVPTTGAPTVPAPPTAPVVPTTAPGAPPAPSACTNNSAFVADVTVPDGTNFSAGQTFNKIWKMSNTGTCAWGSGYQLVFISGEAMTSSTVVSVPATAPGATADILVPMTTPATAGDHTGSWRMRSADGAIFGQTVTVKITVPGAPPPAPPPSGCSGNPAIASFTASSTTITAGNSTSLNWGAVTNADSVEIDHGIGGVPAPGSTSVSPGSTTTYTMTAHCGSNTTTAQVTITVNPAPPAGQPDLTVTALEFDPATPTPGGSFQVRITISNPGPVAVSDFVVRALRQAPGANCLTDPGTVLFDRHTSVGAGATIVYTENATISAAGNYRICARLDHVNAVAESNENNNLYQSNLTVAAAGQPDLRPHFIGLSDNTPNAGQTISANLTLRNDGTAAVSSFTVRLLRQTTSASCVPGNHPGTVLFDRTTGPLSASGSMVFSETFSFGSAGTYRLCVVLDHLNNIAESNEGNNTLQSGNITVSP